MKKTKQGVPDLNYIGPKRTGPSAMARYEQLLEAQKEELERAGQKQRKLLDKINQYRGTP